MSLRGLINLRIVLSVIIIMMLGSVTAVWQARQSVAKEVQSSINLALQMIEFGFAQIPASNRYGHNWLPQINALQQVRHIQISIAEEGEEPIELLNRHQTDAAESRPPQWFINAVMTDYLTADYEITMSDGGIKTLLIKADPMDEIIEAWGESQAFFWSIVAMLAAIFFAINLVFHSMLKAVQSILSGLRHVESGDYGKVLPSSQISEFDAIASEVNAMSAALKIAEENNQALALHTIQIQETERQTMSRELHDEMGQSLTAIKAMAVTIKQPKVDITLAADSIIEVCNHLAVVVRSMMRTLHPLSLAELGLEATLTDLINEWSRRNAALKINLEYDSALEQLDNKVAIHIYRVVQECLTNVVRHADASIVDVRILLLYPSSEQARIDLSVVDNGQGGKADYQGFGVLGMRERVESLGGGFEFNSQQGQGVQVKAWMPFIAMKDQV
ncbi:sensor histidine kinase [Methylophaga sp. 41_12_T18]|nr:sensor histidine kinase [Methylophaga sp. 41_12_T18]